jgi:preprotein translocase subunit SecG
MTLAMTASTWFGAFLLFAIWVALAFWPARVAGRKGHSFVGYFILSLFFFPLALIMAYMVHDRQGMHVQVA